MPTNQSGPSIHIYVNMEFVIYTTFTCLNAVNFVRCYYNNNINVAWEFPYSRIHTHLTYVDPVDFHALHWRDIYFGVVEFANSRISHNIHSATTYIGNRHSPYTDRSMRRVCYGFRNVCMYILVY